MSSSEVFSSDRRLFERLSKAGKLPRVVYDIGASKGGWSAAVSDGLPPAIHHLFEPLSAHPEYKAILEWHLNNHPSWRLHSIALASDNGFARMSIDNNVVGSTIVDMSAVPSIFGSQIEVPQRRLDDYARENDLPPPDFVKIDTQASEHLILEGGRQTIAAAGVLLVETWFYRGYGPATPLISDIIEIVDSLGFVLFEFGDEYRDTSGRLVSKDAVFMKPELAVSMIVASD